MNNNRIVIENEPQICEDEIAVVTPGKYSVICSGEFNGPYRTSYVLDSRGRLLFKANDDIVCADNSHYVTVDQNTYLIKTYIAASGPSVLSYLLSYTLYYLKQYFLLMRKI